MKQFVTLVAMPLLSLLFSTQSFAQAINGTNWDGNYGWRWGHMMFGGAMMVFFWGAVVVLIIITVKALTRRSGVSQAPLATSNPLDILKERFAKGEIDEAEFKARKKTLLE